MCYGRTFVDDVIFLENGLCYQSYKLSCGCTGEYLYWKDTQDCFGCSYYRNFQCTLTACCKTKSYVVRGGNITEWDGT